MDERSWTFVQSLSIITTNKRKACEYRMWTRKKYHNQIKNPFPLNMKKIERFRSMCEVYFIDNAVKHIFDKSVVTAKEEAIAEKFPAK